MIRFLLLLILITSCGKNENIENRFTSAHHFYANQTQVWKDTDKDGIQDRFDFDIDGDGIPNLADQYPYDPQNFGEDSNHNGIPDFIDFEFHPTLKELSSIQERLLKEKGIYLINAESDFTKEEILSIENILLNEEINLRLSFNKLKVVAKYPAHKRSNFVRASFDPYWEQISFYDVPELNNILSFNASFVHELGHVYQHESPEAFEEFKKNPLYLTQYAHSSLEEAFAEMFLFKIQELEIFDLDISRFEF
ncbi:MAG TPA: thrombospondin type 3 repeat-containing protein [Bacteriovoracaceae bacterium]|nr:thrombospondin type 3 repeat-containing protein [Bacteriovoracaceae bacterium]